MLEKLKKIARKIASINLREIFWQQRKLQFLKKITFGSFKTILLETQNNWKLSLTIVSGIDDANA